MMQDSQKRKASHPYGEELSEGSLKQSIHITALSSISALGNSQEEVWQSYQSGKHFLSKTQIGKQSVWAAPLPRAIKEEIGILCRSDAKYKNLDDSVLYAIHVARTTVKNARWGHDSNFGINIGSSRGATSLFEKFHQEFLETESTSTLASPTTTLGNISSWVAHDLGSKGPEISHSVTCSTSLHALLNAIAWLQSGMTERFLVGGSEAPLTPFTIAQMQALKIYADSNVRLSAVEASFNDAYPCRALDLKKKQNTMVLGEAAAMACLEKNPKGDSLAEIVGIGYATEPLQHNVSISTDAQCFQKSMKMALNGLDVAEVDAIVMHAPGTVKGDSSEFNAIKKVFGEKHPALTTNKWKTGHTFGASGMLSIEMAILMLQHQEFIFTPFFEQSHPKEIKHVMVNAVGFGGNAVSILLKAPSSK
ncbi:beta-ketoacyl synthase N-terminal-like domain-containing protein [Allomuricauda sp. d1]|uniref:beta-ketoacyl synthase N-terminal-like domain-containing protein n=1 Tax=Allomuricauda sp. d1 TaxID=3136725 RepID=UPI0031D95B85